MSDYEDEYDDLPSISVNSSARDSSVLSMPPAAELASQRAREEETERELLQLRARHDLDLDHDRLHPRPRPPTVSLAHSDSSGSEGEASLAAAVTALQVQAGLGAAAASGAEGAVELLAPLLQRLDGQDEFLAEFLHAIKDADPDTATQLAEQVLDSIASAVMGGGARWSSAEVGAVGAWLCCAAVWGAPPLGRGRVRRTLHRLLGSLDEGRVGALAHVLAAAPVRARLHMSDAARTGAGAGAADTLADLLLATVLRDLCTLDGDGDVDVEAGETTASAGVGRSWARLDARTQYLVVGAAGRALAAAPRASPARRRLLAALALPAPNLDRRHPDHLKVLVGASKLQLLFRADR